MRSAWVDRGRGMQPPTSPHSPHTPPHQTRAHVIVCAVCRSARAQALGAAAASGDNVLTCRTCDGATAWRPWKAGSNNTPTPMSTDVPPADLAALKKISRSAFQDQDPKIVLSQICAALMPLGEAHWAALYERARASALGSQSFPLTAQVPSCGTAVPDEPVVRRLLYVLEKHSAIDFCPQVPALARILQPVLGEATTYRLLLHVLDESRKQMYYVYTSPMLRASFYLALQVRRNCVLVAPFRDPPREPARRPIRAPGAVRPGPRGERTCMRDLSLTVPPARTSHGGAGMTLAHIFPGTRPLRRTFCGAGTARCSRT